MMSPNGSVPPIYVPPGYVSQVFILCYFQSGVCDWHLIEVGAAPITPRLSVCFLSDHRRERSAAGSGFTSATRVPPRGALPSPPSSTSTPCPPAYLYPTPCHDAPSASPLHKHGRRSGRRDFSVHLSVPSSSYVHGAG